MTSSEMVCLRADGVFKCTDTELENGNLCKVLQVSSEQATKHSLNKGGHPDVDEFGMGGKGEPMAITGDGFKYKASFGDYLKQILICVTELVMVSIALPIVIDLKGGEMWIQNVAMYVMFVTVVGGTLYKINQLATGNGSKWLWSSIDMGVLVLTFIEAPLSLVVHYPLTHG